MGGIFGGGGGGSDAADASRDAAEIQTQYQREALEYLKEREELPMELRDQALQSLADTYFGGTGNIFDRPEAVDQAALVNQAQSSPLYSAIMGNQAAGEEAILRNQAATGGLRSGSTSYNLADYNTQLQNQALLQSYNQALGEKQYNDSLLQYGNALTGQELGGIQSLAMLPSSASQIAGMQAGIGQTLAQGDIAAAQAQQAGQQQGFNNMMGLGQLGLAAYSAFSDRRLKKNIKPQGVKHGSN